ncbi:SGNH/GDSL hydrolase family protein [Sphingobacterium sp. lm-10]|uniref:SGNH/GDSL hydrolase family protein n=1 Tax=Sphingobacterium sp. lm-10 TaxID=2944904 RepID=UPI0020211236|nr:SGNH/GDSL hydrolase family protein [Sphingobacterium sp. lm-10]MCL7988170.1 SGNH/GDSL hydrolase family protein [Sphingobacterium sp. lm-10]
MKKISNNYIIALASLFSVASCAPTFDDVEVRTSTADFSKYIAIGNSLTAGFADGGLYLEGQRVAFPNLISAQMQQIGGASGFTSPFFREDQANGSGYIRLTSLEGGNPVTAPVTNNLAIRGQSPVTGGPLYTKYEGAEYHNYGVPGMRLDLAFAPGFGSVAGNPYFERLLEGNDVQTTYFGFTSNRQHTFFSFWLGNNDVLGYAMNGAVAAGPTTTLTAVPTFTGAYNNYIDALTTNNRKGIVATIPDVTSIPFFTTVTYAAILAGVQAQAPTVQNIFITTKTGVRPATSEDYFFLTFPRERLGQPLTAPFGLHPASPIPDNMVLDRDEVVQVRERVNQYNAVIRRMAETKDLALVDMHDFLNQVRDGFIYNSIPISSLFIRGNAFSLDGVHLTPLGNAIVANTFIEAINSKYNSSIPRIDVTQYSGVRMPN